MQTTHTPVLSRALIGILCALACLHAAHAQAVDCSVYTASISLTTTSITASFVVTTNVVPHYNSLRLFVHDASGDSVSVVIPSDQLTLSGGGTTLTSSWAAGAAPFDASDVSRTVIRLILGLRPTSYRLHASYHTSDGCHIASSFTNFFSWDVDNTGFLPEPTVSLVSTSNPAQSSPLVFRDGDEAVLRVRMEFGPQPTQPLFLDLIPPSPTSCIPYFPVHAYTVYANQLYVDALVPLKSTAFDCLCEGARQNRDVCNNRTGLTLHAVATVDGLVRSSPAAPQTVATVTSSPTAFPITFSAIPRANSEVVANGVVGMAPVCSYVTRASLYRRGDTLEAICDFPEKPTAVSGTITVGSTQMLYALNQHIVPLSSGAFWAPDGMFFVRGRAFYRRRMRWVVGSAFVSGTYTSLSQLHFNSGISTSTRSFSLLFAYNYNLGADRTKTFYADATVLPPPSGVSASTPSGTPTTMSLLASNAVGSADPAVCSLNVNTTSGLPARRGDTVTTRMVCDSRLTAIQVRVSTLLAPVTSESTDVFCASTSDTNVFTSHRPSYRITLGSFSWDWSYVHPIGGSFGLFSQTTCTATITGVLRTTVSVIPLGSSLVSPNTYDFVIAAGRPRDSYRAVTTPVSQAASDPVFMNLTGILSAAHTSIVVRLTPHAVYAGAGAIPAPGTNFDLEIGPAQSSELDTFVRSLVTSAFVAQNPTFDPFSSRPYDISVRSNDPSDGTPTFRLVNTSIVLAPRAAAPTLSMPSNSPTGLVTVSDDVTASYYWVWIESPLLIFVFDAVGVSFANHAELRTSTRLSYTYNIPLYRTPASLAEYVVQQSALSPGARRFPLIAVNLRVMLGLEPKPRTRLVQMHVVSPDAALGSSLTTTTVTHSEVDIFSSPSQGVAIASPTSHTTWVGAVPFVVAYRTAQLSDASHVMHVTSVSSGLVVTTLVCMTAVPSVSDVGAFAFDLRGGDLTHGGLWRTLQVGMPTALSPGAYNFAFSALSASGDSATVTTVFNVSVDSATSPPVGATATLSSLSGELRDRTSVALAFVPPETYSRVRVLFRRSASPSLPVDDPLDDLLSLNLTAPQPAGAFVSGVSVARAIALTEPMVRLLTPSTPTLPIEVLLECFDAGGNPPVRVLLGSAGEWSMPYLARRDVVDFRSTVEMNERVVVGGVTQPRTASVVLEAHLALDTMRLELIPIQPTVAAHAPGSTTPGGVLGHPVVRAFDVIPPAPNPSTGLTRVEFDLNIEALQTATVIFPKPSIVGVRDGSYVARFTLGGQFVGVTTYTVNQTSPLVVDTRTLLPVFADCVVAQSNSSLPINSVLHVGVHDVITCSATLPEPGLNVSYELVEALSSGGADPSGPLAVVIAYASYASSHAFALASYSWRVGLRFGNVSAPGSDDGATRAPDPLPDIGAAHGLIDRRVAMRLSYRDTRGNAVVYSTPVIFTLRAGTEHMAMRFTRARTTSIESALLVYAIEPSYNAELRVHAASPDALFGPVTTPPLYAMQLPLRPRETGGIMLAHLSSPDAPLSSDGSQQLLAPPPPMLRLADGHYVIEIRSQSTTRSVNSSSYAVVEQVGVEFPIKAPQISTRLEFVVDTVSDEASLVRNTAGVATIGSLHRLTCTSSEVLVKRVLHWVDSMNATRVTIPIVDGAPCMVEWTIGEVPRNSQSLPFANVSGVPSDVTGSVAETWYAYLHGEDVLGNPRSVSAPVQFEIAGLAPSAPPILTQPQAGAVVGRTTRTMPLSYTLPSDPLPNSVFLYFNSQPDANGDVGPTYAIRLHNARTAPALYAISLVRAAQAANDPVVLTPITADSIRDGLYQIVLCYTTTAGATAGCARTSTPVRVDTVGQAPVVSLVTDSVPAHPMTREPVYNEASGIRLRIVATDTTTVARFRLTLHHSPLAGHSASLGVGSAAAGAIGASTGLSVFPTRGLEPGTFFVSLPLIGGESADTTASSSAIPDGNYTIRVVYTDGVGNVAPPSVVLGRAIVDTRTLPVRVISPVAGQSFSNGALVPIQVGFDVNEFYGSVRMLFVNSLGVEFAYDVRTVSRTATACSWDTAEAEPALFSSCFSSGGALPNGVYDITVRAIDANSNPSNSVQVLSVSIFTRVSTGDNDTAPPPPEDTITLPPQLVVEVDDQPLVSGAPAPRVVAGGVISMRFVLGEAASAGSMQLEMWLDGVRRVAVRPDAMQINWVIGSSIPGTILFQTDSVVPTGRVSGQAHLVFSYTDERRNPRASVSSPFITFAAANVSTAVPLSPPTLVSLTPLQNPWRYELNVLFPSVESGATAIYTFRTSAPYAVSGSIPSSRQVSLVLRHNPNSGTFIDPSNRVVFLQSGLNQLNVSYVIGARSASTMLSLTVDDAPPVDPDSSSGGGALSTLAIVGIAVGGVVVLVLGGIAIWMWGSIVKMRLVAEIRFLLSLIPNVV